MNRIRYSIAVNMQDTRAVDTGLRLKQGDSGIRIAIKVFNNDEEYFDSANIPQIVFRRPDGSSVVGTVKVDNTGYYYDIAGSELQYGGKVIADLKFDWDEIRKSTYSFIIECVSDTISDKSSAAGVYVADYLSVKREVDKAVAQTQSDRERAEEAAETAERVVGFDGYASTVIYDNGTSEIDADNVQDAIDKIANKDITVVVLTSADDLDNITDVTKTYAVTYGDYPLNSPVTNASFRVEVKYDGRSNEANRRQIVYLKAQNVRYERTYNNSVWSAWVKDVPNELQHKVVTGTTDANGLISLGVEKSRVYAAFIVSNTGTDGKYVITPAASSNSYVRIVSAVSGANVANYGITINVLYI